MLYGFLTLSDKPNADYVPPGQWNGRALYETMTLAPILEVMNDQTFTHTWQAVKIKAMIQACHEEGKKFVWAIGGWSDLEQTIGWNQIDAFVQLCVDLLKQYGDGVDFDWEHLTQLASGGPNPNGAQQLKNIAEAMYRLRRALDREGLQNK